jgi:hypothetical protein
VNTDTKGAAGVSLNTGGRRTGHLGAPSVGEGSAPTKKERVSLKPRGTSASKTKKVALRSSRMSSKAEKLVCRYCGSDDLAPSFKKRRDARCRACFKKRYASTPQSKNAKRTRKAKVAK